MKNVLSVLFLFFLSLIVHAQEIHYGDNASAGGYVTVNGIKMYYEIYGSGQPLLLLHGNSGSIASKAAIIPSLAKKYKVVAVDSRCHGKSGCNSDELNYNLMASDINELLNELKIDSALIWGHSDGAIIGLIMAYSYPVRVKKLVASGANLEPDTSALQPELVQMMKMYPMMPDSMMRKRIKLMVDNPHILTTGLNKIKAPVMIMAGDRDAIRDEHTIKIFHAIPNSNLCIFPATTHFIENEKTPLLLFYLNEFFSKPFSKPSTVEIARQMAVEMNIGNK